MKRIILSVFLLSSLSTQSARGEELLKSFLRSCTYGVIAGGLVGAASLAFSEDPGSNLNPIARGASLGLYGGIAVGLIGMNSDTQAESVLYIIPNRNSILLGVNFLSF